MAWAIGTGNFQPEWFGVPLPPCGCRSCEEPGEILFRKERRDKVHGKEGKCRRGGLLPKRDGEDFFRQEAGAPAARMTGRLRGFFDARHARMGGCFKMRSPVAC